MDDQHTASSACNARFDAGAMNDEEVGVRRPRAEMLVRLKMMRGWLLWDSGLL